MPATPPPPASGNAKAPPIHPKREWMSTFGVFANDPIFEAAMDAGEAWGKSQTWEKEQAALKTHAGA
ncbi:MAG TPA: hypothetical protein DDZ88_26250 [Verrucomicrobiales bacterium]|nr:hypothetical protein [Verrucomicrobiales bacterium]